MGPLPVPTSATLLLLLVGSFVNTLCLVLFSQAVQGDRKVSACQDPLMYSRLSVTSLEAVC